MSKKEVKALASKLNGKAGEVRQLETKIEEATQQASFPQAEKVEEVFTPDPLSAHVKTIEKRTIPAERDPLESLREQRQNEIGTAYIEGRAPAVTAFDERIAHIEGARAALPILERQLAVAKEELQDMQSELQIALYPVLNEYFVQAENEYARVVEELRARLGDITAVAQIASRIGGRLGEGVTYRARLYVDGLRARGLVVRTRQDDPSAVHLPSWLTQHDLPSAATKKEELKNELAALGVEV